jgi:hypothetical protein
LFLKNALGQMKIRSYELTVKFPFGQTTYRINDHFRKSFRLYDKICTFGQTSFSVQMVFGSNGLSVKWSVK